MQRKEFRNRGGRIRTDDFLLPKQALYRTELRPVMLSHRYFATGKANDTFAAVPTAGLTP